MARVKIYVKEVEQLDENSVGVLLDFDNVANPEKVVETIKATKSYFEGSITFWEAVKILITIWKG